MCRTSVTDSVGVDRSPSLNGSNGEKMLEASGVHVVRQEDEAAPPARDGRGRFAKGNKGGPGNPFGPRIAVLRQAAYDAFSPEIVREIFASMIVRALGGDLAAAKLVLAYAIGIPAAAGPDQIDACD